MSGFLKQKTVTYIAVLLSVFIASACDLHEPGNFTEAKIQIQEERFSEQLPLAEANEAFLSGLAGHYDRYGDGPVYLSVTYDPKSKTSTAMAASTESARISQSLGKKGLNNVQAGIIPVQGQGEDAQLLVTYNGYTAQEPDCKTMPGMDDTVSDTDEEYKLGCGVETMFARQVSRPKDLLGREQTEETTDGRRASNVPAAYRAGVRNERLEGESASER